MGTYTLSAKVIINGVVGFHSNSASRHQHGYDVGHNPKQAPLVELTSKLRPFPVGWLQGIGWLKPRF